LSGMQNLMIDVRRDIEAVKKGGNIQ